MDTNNSQATLARKLWAFFPWLLFFVILISIFMMGIAIKKKNSAITQKKISATAAQSQNVNVITQIIEPMPLVDQIDLPAVTKAWQDIVIKAEVAGKVLSVKVREGDLLTEGQIIAVLDSRDYSNTLSAIEAQLNLAKSNYDRLKSLQKHSAVSVAKYEEALATLSELKASEQDAQLDLERCTIKAPFAGVINDLPAKEGMLLSYADPVAQLIEVSRLKIDVPVPEADVSDLTNLTEAQVHFSSLGGLTVTAKRHFLASQPTNNSMTYLLQLAITNPNSKILPGMFARTTLIKNRLPDALAIPIYAVLHLDDQQYVYIIENDQAVKRTITTGFIQDWKIQVLSGLSKGDHVAIVGHRGLENEQPVKVIKSVTDPGELAL